MVFKKRTGSTGLDFLSFRALRALEEELSGFCPIFDNPNASGNRAHDDSRKPLAAPSAVNPDSPDLGCAKHHTGGLFRELRILQFLSETHETLRS